MTDPDAHREPELTIVIPCLNEEPSIALVIAEYRHEFPDARILVIDNGSTDRTVEEALKGGVEVISEPQRGKAKAVAKALAHIETEVAIMVDGDGSYPAEGARILYSQYLAHPADLITGIRHSSEKNSSAFRPLHQFGTWLFAFCTSTVFAYRSQDIFSGLRLFSRRFYKNVPILSNGFELEMELTVQAVDKGFSFYETEIPFRERAGGTQSKLHTLRDGYRIFKSLLLLFRDYKPLYFFGAIAFSFFIGGLLAGFPPVYEYIQTRMVGRFPLAILAAALMNLSLFTLLTGMVTQANLRYHREAFQIRIRNFRNQP